MFDNHNAQSQPHMVEPTARLAEVAVSFLDNGFVVRVTGFTFNKNYVIQASSNKAEEIEAVLDVIRRAYYQSLGEE